MNYSTLAIDLGTQCGWALMKPDGSIHAGSENIGPSQKEGPGARIHKFRCLLERLSLNSYPLCAIYYEDVKRHTGTSAAHVYGALKFTLHDFCERNSIAIGSYGVGEIKKFATNNGSAKKPAMIAAAKDRWPWIEIVDDNQADAMWILALAIHDMKNSE